MTDLAHEDGLRLAAARPLPRQVVAPGRRRARTVRTLKLLLPAVAALAIGGVLIWPGAFNRVQPLELPEFDAPETPVERLTMLKPRYIGTDGKGRPFMITADLARQAPNGEQSLRLTSLQADMTMSDGGWFTVLAQSGRYRESDKTLLLEGQVSVYSDKGYEFHGSQLTVDLEDGVAVTERPVRGQGPLGEVAADRMEVRQDGRRLLFGDGVKVTLRPDGAE